jgi:hypothetical protein
MRAGGYYVVAGLLVLATVPMYRYIFQRARALDRSPPAAVVSPPVVRTVVARVPQYRRIPLMAGERCVGGVLLTVSGSTYTQFSGADGRPVRCDAQAAFVPY